MENDRLSRTASSTSPFRSRGDLPGSGEEPATIGRHGSRASFSSLIEAPRGDDVSINIIINYVKPTYTYCWRIYILIYYVEKYFKLLKWTSQCAVHQFNNFSKCTIQQLILLMLVVVYLVYIYCWKILCLDNICGILAKWSHFYFIICIFVTLLKNVILILIR